SCDQLREKQARLRRQANRHTGQRVVTLQTFGVLSTQVNDAAIAAKTIDVTLWVEGKAQDVAKQFANEADLLGSSLVVGVGTLEPGARQHRADVKLGYRQVAQLTRRGLSGVKAGSGSGLSLLLAIGSLYLLQTSLEDTHKELKEAIG